MTTHFKRLQQLLGPELLATFSPDAACVIEELCRDAARIDWLADLDNHHGAVQLPTACVEENPHCMRSAIDAAMCLDAQEHSQ